MATFLCIQSTYNEVELTIFKNHRLDIVVSIAKEQASAQLLKTIQEILSSHQLSLKNLDFIAVNQGPAPFTTLRTVIATVNGIQFATHIPLIGVDGLAALVHEHSKPSLPVIALLNAFNKAVYYGFENLSSHEIKSGYAHIDPIIELLHAQYANAPFMCIGNGVELHETLLKEAFPAIIIPSPLPRYCSLHAIAQAAQTLWADKKLATNLMPLYLKKAIEI